MKLKILSLLCAFFAAAGIFSLVACNNTPTAPEISDIKLGGSRELILTYDDGKAENLGSIDGLSGARIDEARIEDGGLIIELINDEIVTFGKIEGLTDAYVADDGSLILVLAKKSGESSILNCGKAIESGSVANDFTYSEIKTEGEVSGYAVTGIRTNTEEVYICPTFNRKPVVEIAENAFSGNEAIKTVHIPDSIKKISGSFSDSALEEIYFGEGLEEVTGYAFARSEKIAKINVKSPESWCNINFADPASNPMYNGADLYLNGEVITEIQLSADAERIGDFAFYYYDKLTAVNTGVGAKSIGERAFEGCENLQKLTVGSGVKEIGELAFSECTSLSDVRLGTGLKVIGGYSFNLCEKIKAIDIPANVQEIGESAFNECTALKDITFHYGLEKIGDGAFAGCYSIDKFLMPDSVTEIGYGILLNVSSSGFDGMVGRPAQVSEITISDSLTTISDYAFSGCAMKTVVLGRNVRLIRYAAFFGCMSLESIVIPASLTTVQSYSFYMCVNLKTVYYMGTPTKWNNTEIGNRGNDNLERATVYFYSAEKPATEGNYWHYVDGVPQKW